MPPRLALALLIGCAPPPSEPPAAAVAGPLGFSLGGPDGLAAEARCDEGGAAPAVAWRARAGQVAWVVASDGPEGRAVRWVAWDQPAAAGGRPAGTRPGQFPPLQGASSGGRIGWEAPCAPAAVAWRAWLLPAPLRAAPTTPLPALLEALDAAAVARESGTAAFALEPG